MCRLFSMLSVEESSPYDYIFNSAYSIKKQAEIEGHKDGWGSYFYHGNRLSGLIRSTSPLIESLEMAENFVNGIKSNLSGFFIRKASNPMNIEFEKLLTIDATQPFTFKNITFMHNGSLNYPEKIFKKIKDFTCL